MLKRKPRLLVIAGPNGSGKTTLTRRILRHAWGDGCTYINPDNIAQDKFGDWNSPEATRKAAILSDQLREECLLERGDLAFETVLSIEAKVDFIKRAKDAGYFIRIFFVSTDDPSINAARITNRVLEGGHSVPIDKIIDRYYRSLSFSLDAALLFHHASSKLWTLVQVFKMLLMFEVFLKRSRYERI